MYLQLYSYFPSARPITVMVTGASALTHLVIRHLPFPCKHCRSIFTTSIYLVLGILILFPWCFRHMPTRTFQWSSSNMPNHFNRLSVNAMYSTVPMFLASIRVQLSSGVPYLNDSTPEFNPTSGSNSFRSSF